MSNIKLFESKQIRTAWNEADEKWYFVVSDVVQVLTDTPNPSDYIKKMRKRDEKLSNKELRLLKSFEKRFNLCIKIQKFLVFKKI